MFESGHFERLTNRWLQITGSQALLDDLEYENAKTIAQIIVAIGEHQLCSKRCILMLTCYSL